MCRTLVTGATGFIGRHLVRRLVTDGHDVTIMVRRSSNLQPLEHLSLEHLEADLRDPDALAVAMRTFDRVFHIAGAIAAHRYRDLLHINGRGTRNLLRVCARQTTPPVVTIVSSLAAAGPVSEGDVRREEDRERPISRYGCSKRLAERVAERYARMLPITAVRPGIVFGPEDRQTLQIFQAIHRWGLHVNPGWRSPRLSLIEVRDLVQLLIAASERGTRLAWPAAEDTTRAGYYFAACESRPTYVEWGRMVQRALHRNRVTCLRIPKLLAYAVAAANQIGGRWRDQPQTLCIDKIREATAASWECTAQRARDELQFNAWGPLDDQLAATIDWYRHAGWL